VVARHDVAPGTELSAADLTTARISADRSTLPDRAFMDVDQLVGRVPQISLVMGQPIAEPMLAPAGAGTGLEALVPPGMRAITVEVNEFSGLAGLLRPGCRVDVLATLQDGGGSASGVESVARTIVQNVKVTAVGRQVAVGGAEEPSDVRSVTLLATPAQAEAIELATATGRPRLVLRSALDAAAAKSIGVTLAELRGSRRERATGALALINSLLATPRTPAPVVHAVEPAPEPAVAVAEAIAAVEPARRTVRVIRGGVASSVTLDLPVGSQPTASRPPTLGQDPVTRTDIEP
jgi:pilus assembly protein CpaB